MTLLKKRQLKRPCSWPVVSCHYSVHCGQGAARWTSGGHLLLAMVVCCAAVEGVGHQGLSGQAPSPCKGGRAECLLIKTKKSHVYTIIN